MQLNASAHVYAYDSVHTATEEACPPATTSPAAIEANANSAGSAPPSTTSIQTAPGADVAGLALELLAALTVGSNLSATDTGHASPFIVVDGVQDLQVF